MSTSLLAYAILFALLSLTRTHETPVVASLAARLEARRPTVTVVLFEPHPDDIVLFCCHTLMREQTQGPVKVITVFSEANHRAYETIAAMDSLNVYDWLGWLDTPYEHHALCRKMAELDDVTGVWAPMVEVEGHLDHNLVGRAAEDVFGDRCRFYATYRRGQGRTRTDNEVTPEPDWYAKKFNAMSCYVSQINHPQMRPWFNDWEKEWIA